MGLNKELFEGEVDEGFICGLCDQVLLNPVTAGCSHIVCQTCVNRSLKARVNHAMCPVCSAKLTSSTEDTTIDFKLNLLNLTLRCSHWCGSTFVLADLPDHMDICPCAPVECEFRAKGCCKSVKRCDFSKHVEECDFRTVECEACGHTTMYRELFTHQSKVRCLEKKLKQQVIRESKAATQETNRHRERLFRDTVRLDQHQRKTVIDHSKSLNPSRRKMKVSTDIDSEFDYSPRDGIFLTEEVVQQHSTEVLQLKEKEDTREMQRQRRRKDNTKTPHSSRSGYALQMCSQCNRKFRADNNSAVACRWHVGPMVPLFGGTCFACGRLDYQPGCATGHHRV